MKTILFLLAACAWAASADPLDSLVASVIKKGKAKPIAAPLAQKLGFPGPVVTKAVAVRGEDKVVHALYVVFDPHDKTGKPEALVWARAAAASKNGAQEINALDVKTSLSGVIESAVQSHGAKGAMDEQAVSIKLPEIVESLAAEKKLILEKAPAQLK